MDLLLKSDCPIYTFSGLGGHILSFFIFGKLLHICVDLCHFSCILAQLSPPANYIRIVMILWHYAGPSQVRNSKPK